MRNIFKLATEYIIRHLKLNNVLVRLTDRWIGDSNNERYDGAKDLLRSVYTPADFRGLTYLRKVNRLYHLQIIVAMYNEKNYISQCLNSILEQDTAYTYRIYVVDDGSTDGSYDFVKENYQDERIVLISMKNGGAASARNAAIEEMVADYIMFIDADDRLKQGAVTKLLDAAYSEGADVVEGGYDVFRKRVHAVHCHKNEAVQEPCGNLWGFSWGKVFLSDLFRDFCFPEQYWYEDTFISYLIYTKCKKAVTIEDCVYSYRNNIRGMSRIRKNNKKILDAFWIINLVIEEMLRRRVVFSQGVYEQLLISMLTGAKRMICLDEEQKRCVLSAYSEILQLHFTDFKTNNKQMKVFEKVIRNNDYRKYRILTICMESM